MDGLRLDFDDMEKSLIFITVLWGLVGGCSSPTLYDSYCEGNISRIELDTINDAFYFHSYTGLGAVVEKGTIKYGSKSKITLKPLTHVLEVDLIAKADTDNDRMTRFTVYDYEITKTLDSLVPFAFELRIGKNKYQPDSLGNIDIYLPTNPKEVIINDRIEISDSTYQGKWYKIFIMSRPVFRKEAFEFRIRKDHIESESGSKFYPCPPDSSMSRSFKEWKEEIQIIPYHESP